MAGVTFNFLTKEPIGDCPDALARVWSVQHWVNTLDRVKQATLREQSQDQQVFDLHFDAGGETVDKVTVLRTRSEHRISVKHLVPPPGIDALSGAWWVDPEQPDTLYASRQMTMSPEQATVARARNVQKILRENITALLRDTTLETSVQVAMPVQKAQDTLLRKEA